MNGSSDDPWAQWVQRGSTISGAPLTDRTRLPARWTSVAWKPRPGSNGISSIRSQSSLPCGASTPARSAPSATAASVGWGRRPAGGGLGVARRPARSSLRPSSDSPSSGSSVPSRKATQVSDSRPSVTVPVLSTHMTCTRPSASMARVLRTRMPWRANRRAADSWATPESRGRPSGTAATARLTAPAASWPRGWRRSSPTTTVTTPLPMATGTVRAVRYWSRASTPVAGASCPAATARRASVAAPVATTTAIASPAATEEPS